MVLTVPWFQLLIQMKTTRKQTEQCQALNLPHLQALSTDLSPVRIVKFVAACIPLQKLYRTTWTDTTLTTGAGQPAQGTTVKFVVTSLLTWVSYSFTGADATLTTWLGRPGAPSPAGQLKITNSWLPPP